MFHRWRPKTKIILYYSQHNSNKNSKANLFSFHCASKVAFLVIFFLSLQFICKQAMVVIFHRGTQANSKHFLSLYLAKILQIYIKEEPHHQITVLKQFSKQQQRVNILLYYVTCQKINFNKTCRIKAIFCDSVKNIQDANKLISEFRFQGKKVVR